MAEHAFEPEAVAEWLSVQSRGAGPMGVDSIVQASIAISLKRIADFVDKLPISSDLGHDLRHIMHNAGQDFAQGMRGNT